MCSFYPVFQKRLLAFDVRALLILKHVPPDVEGEWMDRGVMLGVADRKMTHKTKEDDGDQWTRVASCVFPRGDVPTKDRVKQIF
jgi:hypothetical protein